MPGLTLPVRASFPSESISHASLHPIFKSQLPISSGDNGPDPRVPPALDGNGLYYHFPLPVPPVTRDRHLLPSGYFRFDSIVNNAVMNTPKSPHIYRVCSWKGSHWGYDVDLHVLWIMTNHLAKVVVPINTVTSVISGFPSLSLLTHTWR